MLCRRRCVTCCRSVCVCSKRRRARTGPTGPTGVTGVTGPTGSTGVTGPTVTANNAYITSISTKTVATNATIPLDSNAILNGTAISHVAGSSDITLAPNQTYSVSYQTEATVPAGPTTISVGLSLGGAIINESTDQRTTTVAGDIVPLSGNAIVTTSSATTLNIKNLTSSTTDFKNTSISIIKLQ